MIREYVNTRIAWYGGLLLAWVFVVTPITSIYMMMLNTVALEHWPSMPQWLVWWHALAVTVIILAPAAYFVWPLADELMEVWHGDSALA